MLKKTAVENILTAAMESGADFAEIYAEEAKRSSIAMVNGKIETALGGMDYGAGVRLFFGNQAIYGFTNDLTEENLIRIAREGAAAMKGDRIYNIKGWKEMAKRCINPIQIMPDSIAKTAKAEQLRRASAAAKEYNELITQTRAGYLEVMKHVLVANSEGVWGEEDRTRSRFTVEAVASSATEKQSGHLGPGGSEGFELFDRIDVEATAREAARVAVTMLGAKPCPAGKMPVVIDNGFGGVIFHEACGHGLEATAVARNASVFAGK
ncbi:MAG: TldD/PmbA family protein, partial [Anaerotignum sp.]|nr:TldD/PmbA family protein [Anaerotignum sp.]